jgi:hypothetical protein
MWNHIRDKTVKTRVNHVCSLCGDTIKKGETAITRTGADDIIYTFYMHLDCEKHTHDWDEMDWESFDPSDFKSIYLKQL